MSGLVSFFAAFLSPPPQSSNHKLHSLKQRQIDSTTTFDNNRISPTEVVVAKDNNNDDDRNENSNSNNKNIHINGYGEDHEGYNESLSSVRRCLDLENRHEANTNDNDLQDTTNQHDTYTDILTQDQQRNENNQDNDDQGNYIDINEWKLMESKKLTAFIRKRIIAKDEDDDISEESDDDFMLNDDEEEEKENSPPEQSLSESYLETQEYQEVINPHINEVAQNRATKVPHLSEVPTDSIANSISDIDLYSHIVNLDSVLILRMTPLLSTKRIDNWNTITYKRQSTEEDRMIDENILVPSMEFYGPLVTAYKNDVCCMQLLQQSSDDTSSKIYLFLYDGYAQSIASLYSPGDVISITNIPSKCIFPCKYFNIPTSSVLETTLEVGCKSSKYCICVGSKSRITEVSDDGKSKLYFDSDDLNINNDVDDDYISSVITGSSMGEIASNRKRHRDTIEIASPLAKRLRMIVDEQDEEHDDIDEENNQQQGELIATQFITSTNAENIWKAEMNHDSEFNYHTLAQLQSIFESMNPMNYNTTTFYNFYAIVLGSTPPIRTSSGDYSMSITIIDQSLDVYTASLSNKLTAALVASPNVANGTAEAASNRVIKVFTLRIFIEHPSKAPHIVQAGDVLCAHRISIQSYDNQVQLLGKKRVSSYLVIRPNNQQQPQQTSSNNIIRLKPNEWNVVPTSHRTYTFSPFDETKCHELWFWGQRRLHNHPTTISVVQFSIHRLLPDDRYSNASTSNKAGTDSNKINGDITALVMAVIKSSIQNNHSPIGYLRVWDGTGSSKADRLPPCQFNGINNNDSYEDPYYCILNGIRDIIDNVKSFQSSIVYGATSIEAENGSHFLPSELIAPHGLCGKIVNVAIWEESHWKLIESYSLCPGKFIRLRNVNEGCISFENNIILRCIMVHRKSWLTVLPNITFEVSKLLLEHQKRIQRNEPTITCPRRLMLTDISRLERILDNRTHSQFFNRKELTCIATIASEPPPTVFTARFFVTATSPTLNEKDGIKSLCQESHSSPSEYKFHFLLHIRDHTDEMIVYVPDKVAAHFLQVQAKDLCATRNFRNDGINEKLNLRINDLIEKQTRLEGIISSNQVSSKKIKQKQHYYIFESLFVDDPTW